jgi:diguanylate cyclase (GGDEF)-like protein/excisionase family DNA binding protein
VTTALLGQPTDATLSVTKAARLLGVHPNTIRAWSDQGRLRYYRINLRGDRRYRLGDLQGFLAAAEGSPVGLAHGRPPVGPSLELLEAQQPPETEATPHYARDTVMSVAVPSHPTVQAVMDEANIAMRTARDYAQMATWAAQLQSIQQLGNRLNRLRTVRDIGSAIAIELHQLIDYHNARVYRIIGEELIPVAMQGRVGEYVDETPDQLRVRVDTGITGWVAAHGIAQNLPNAAADPRASTIVGTEEDLDESMLLAPMMYDDQVLGVLVLSKLGLDQFSNDDLRLLVIYASFAAGAMANADSTDLLAQRSAALERQLRSQRELLEITESILSSLDPSTILEQITERLAALVAYDNISIEVYDRRANLLMPLTARGVHAEEFMAPSEPGAMRLTSWVLEHNEPQLVVDELADARVLPFESTGPVEGSLIVVPLRDRVGVTGVLTLERLGTDDPFDEEDFELVKLFSAHVSIALNNAEVHRAVEIRARSDDLTGLLNHGTFQQWISQHVRAGSPFSLIMLDLDDFRIVNNELGHQAGDELLRTIANALLGAGRDSDHVFRYGGDEFTFLLTGTEAAGGLRVAERARAAVASVTGPDSAWAALGTVVTASVGVATFPTDGQTEESILLAADRACFVAKRMGRDRVVTAAEGLAAGAELSLQEPTPVDAPTLEPD